MTPQSDQSPERALFDAVVERPPDERRRYLDEHCPDPHLRHRVERLLRADEAEANGGALPGEPSPDAPTRSDPRRTPDRGNDTHFPAIPGYEILTEIGQGGMGVVYKARQVDLDRIVAVKMIRPDVEANPEKVSRFHLEAKVLARIRHLNIVQIYDVGEHEGRPYLVLEFIEGGSLADRLDGQPWPARDAARLLKDLARGIHEAHQHGIVHRDLKPSNVLLPADTLIPKVTDFGIAKLLDTETRQTQTGQILGSLPYMAPEQAGESKLVGRATDVYGLGATLYELLTGKPPSQGDSVAAVLDQVRNREPVPPSQVANSVPRDLETICLKCLEKDPARRYQSAAALAEELEQFLQGQPVKARPVGFVARSWRNLSRRPLAPGLSVAFVSMALFLVVLWLNPGSGGGGGGGPSPPKPDSNTIRVGIKQWVGYTPLVVADDLGLCGGIDLEFVTVESVKHAERLLAANAIEVGMWLVDWHVLAMAQNADAKVVLMLDESLEADAIVARENIKHIGDLRGKKIAYQKDEPSEYLLRRLCEMTRGTDREVRFEDLESTLQDASAENAKKWFMGVGPKGERYDAVGTYAPHVKEAMDMVQGAHLLYSGAKEPGKIVDILAVRNRYLRENQSKVKQLIGGWFAALDILQNKDDARYPEALRSACRFNGQAPPGKNWSAEHLQENSPCLPGFFSDITAAGQMKWGDKNANRAFFQRPDENGRSAFHILFLEAQKLLRGQLRKECNPEDGDGSTILFEMYGS